MTDIKSIITTLNWLVDNNHVPGLLNIEVRQAAIVLQEQADELVVYKKAEAAQEHTAIVTAKRDNNTYKLEIDTKVVLAGTKYYDTHSTVDVMIIDYEPDWKFEVARNIVEAIVSKIRTELVSKIYRQVVEQLPND